MTAQPKKYLRRREAARHLSERGFPRTEKTLAKLACTGGGPVFRLFGRIPLYTPEDLDSWAESKLGKPYRSTSQYYEESAERSAQTVIPAATNRGASE